MLATSSTTCPSAVWDFCPTNFWRAAFSSKNFAFLALYSSTTDASGLMNASPVDPSRTTSSPSFTIETMFSILRTAGISIDLQMIAEWDVLPPISVNTPWTFAGLIPAVIDGVKSSATKIVPSGTALISTSSIPSKILIKRVLMSPKSDALCCVSSSSAIAKICAKKSQASSTAASALIFSPSILASICSEIAGSWIIMIWPSKISASCSPAVTFMDSTIFWVFSMKTSIASLKRFFSASVSSIDCFV